MRFYTKPHKFYCGIDLHARTMSLCIVNQAGEVLLHRDLKAAPGPFLKAMAPYREDIVVCVEGLFTWDWLADLWAQEGMAFVLGHARSMKAIPGGKVKNDRSDAHNIAVLWRGGMLPQASVDPAERRATRDLLRRRIHRMRQRAARLAHIQHTNSQDHRPESGQKLAYQANRVGVAERFVDPAVHKSIEVDLALSGHDDHRLAALELSIVQTAKEHEAQTFSRRRSIPGVGTIRAVVRLDELHDIHRVPRVQACVSYGRLVKGAKESAGTRDGTSGTKIGHASLQWAFSEAAVLFLRHHPIGQNYLARLGKKHGKGKALTVLAHQWARAVYDRCTRDPAFDLDKFLHE
jgi:transposase